VVLTGGMARSELFARLRADFGERPVWVSATEDSTALGAALLAELGLGWHHDARAAADSVERCGHAVEPGPGTAECRRLRRRYGSIYPALRALSGEIRALDGADELAAPR
jgi:sugar (pentulose or hexulose) kinase